MSDKTVTYCMRILETELPEDRQRDAQFLAEHFEMFWKGKLTETGLLFATQYARIPNQAFMSIVNRIRTYSGYLNGCRRNS